MRYSTVVLLGLSLFAAVPAALAQPPLDCSRRSLAAAVSAVRAKDKDATIRFTGVCAGPIVIDVDGVTLEGVGEAIIDGGGQNAVTVAGASRVTLAALAVRNGSNGIVAENGAHVTLTGLDVASNAATGIVVTGGSSAVVADVTTATNGLHGLDVQGGSVLTVQGALDLTGNGVFGLNVNGSSMTVSQATVTSTGNVLGIQIGTNANAFLADPTSAIRANNNLATGLTIVSGSQLVSFGASITATGNTGVGVSVSSKSGLDLDAGSILSVLNNGDGLLVQTNSAMSVFNTPQFSGVPGFSTIDARNNTRSGVRVLSDARLTLVNQARLDSIQNGTVGFTADNGAGVTLVNSTITGNTAGDIVMTFGTRADLRTMVFGTATCDATVLVRGTSGIVCPQ
jgi:hypothetical protein